MRISEHTQSMQDNKALLELTLIFAEQESPESNNTTDNDNTATNIDNKGSDTTVINEGKDNIESGENNGLLNVEANEKAIDSMSEFMRSQGLNPDKYDPKKIVSGVPERKQSKDESEDETIEDAGEKTYKINKQEYKRSEIVSKASLEYGIDISKLSPEKAEKIVNAYVDTQNLTEAKKSVNKNHQSNAEERKALEKERTELTSQKSTFEKDFQKLEAEKEKLEKEIDNLKEKIADEYDDDERARLLTKEVLLTDKREILEEKSEFIKTQSKNLENELQNNYVNDIAYSLITELSDEFATEKPIAEVLTDMLNDNIEKHSEEDCIKADRLEKVIEDYLTKYQNIKEKRPTIIQYYTKFRKLYNPFYVPSQKETEKGIKQKLQEKLDAEKVRKNLIQSEKNKNASPNPKSKILTSTAKNSIAGQASNILAQLNQAS